MIHIERNNASIGMEHPVELTCELTLAIASVLKALEQRTSTQCALNMCLRAFELGIENKDSGKEEVLTFEEYQKKKVGEQAMKKMEMVKKYFERGVDDGK